MFDRSRLGGAAVLALAAVVAFGGRSEAVTAPIAWWKLDDGSGLTAVDSIGANDGTLSGGMNGSEWTTGQFDGALSFGAGNYVNCGADASLTTPQFTIAFWMNADYAQASCVVDKLPDVMDSYGWSMKTRAAEGPNAIWFRVGSEAGGSDTLDVYGPADSYTPGTWVHVAGTYNGTDIILYLDGVNSGATPFPGKAIDASTVELWLAMAARGGGVEPFAGDLDDVQLFNVALSES
jgi:hypothetical protein